jgi:ribonuclease P protein component
MKNAFQPADRVRKQAEFDRIYQARIYAADDVLIINGAANDLPHTRLGLSIGKIVGNAVVRNRWKRLIREAFRISRAELPTGLDLVARPQKKATAEFTAIQQSLIALAAKIAKRSKKSPPLPPAGTKLGPGSPANDNPSPE